MRFLGLDLIERIFLLPLLLWKLHKTQQSENRMHFVKQ